MAGRQAKVIAPAQLEILLQQHIRSAGLFNTNTRAIRAPMNATENEAELLE